MPWRSRRPPTWSPRPATIIPIRLWNPQSGELVATFSGHTAEIRGLAFSPDGRLLASASGKKGSQNTDWTARVWDVATRQPLHVLTGHTGAVRTVAFSPDGKTLASGSYDETVKLWNVASGKLTATLPGHGSAVRTLAFSPDGKTLAAGGNGIQLWRLAERKRRVFSKVYPLRSAALMPKNQIPNPKSEILNPKS